MDLSLSTFWGWHFHQVLKDLHKVLEEDLQAVGRAYRCTPSSRIELFRRSWLDQAAEDLWFRWCFFDHPLSDTKDRLRDWPGNKRKTAESFVNYLSREESYGSFSEGTKTHISHLRDAFFDPQADIEKFLEDWRAVYLQVPTRGTILSHLWEDVRRRQQRTSGFIVIPEAGVRPAGELPPFDFSYLVEATSAVSDVIHVEKQRKISLPVWGDDANDAEAAAEFFEKELYLFFFDSKSAGDTNTLHQQLGIGFFLFIPIHLRRTAPQWEWGGMLQIVFTCDNKGDSGAALGLRDKEAHLAVINIAKTAQVLSSDMLLAHVQELFDRRFNENVDFEKFKRERINNILGSPTSERDSGETYKQLERLFDLEIKRAGLKIDLGQRKQRNQFAHNASVVIDSIVLSFELLSDEARAEMGGALLAKLYLLRDLISSYRNKRSRLNVGDFQYPWKDETELEVYRDIGIELGMARAQDASEDDEGGRAIRIAGRASLIPENSLGQAGFKKYRAFFEPLPNVNPDLGLHLRHSSFAVLTILALKQAVYHTLRARVITKRQVRASIFLSITETNDGVLVECVIENPKVDDADLQKKSKDAEDLKTVAERLSDLRDDPSVFSVDGPEFNVEKDRWVTTITMSKKEVKDTDYEIFSE